jgi:hypothetical protein
MTVEQQQGGSVRDEAIRRLRAKRDFRVHVLAYVVVNGAFVVMWAVTSSGFFWPIFPILGWGIGLFFHGWDTYARKDISEAEIEREMHRLGAP